MTLVFFSVIVNCGISIQKSIYLANNRSADILRIVIYIISLQILLMVLIGYFSGFLGMILIHGALDIVIFVVMLLGTRAVLLSDIAAQPQF